MSTAKPNRSLHTLRIPVEQMPVTMILHDGAGFEAVLFIPFGETILRPFDEGSRFLPIIRDNKVCFVRRLDIACISVPTSPLHPTDGDLPVVFQPVLVQLRSGVRLGGRLRWVAPVGYERTVDHLNADAPYLELQTPTATHYISKQQIALVEER